MNLKAAPENVTPLVGVWVEIRYHDGRKKSRKVTPLVGVWVEIVPMMSSLTSKYVTPLVGVWVEIMSESGVLKCTSSLPLWECGLK